MRYNIGDKVRIKETNQIGTIMHYRYDMSYTKGRIEEIKQYWVKYSQYGMLWFKEEALERIPEFTDEFDLELIDLLIDSYLLHFNESKVESIKKLLEQKQVILLEKGMS